MISVQNLKKNYGGHTVLRDITLDVNRGDVAVIIGPSGSGKSTFLRCLNGLERFDAGSVTVAGLSLESRASSRETQQWATQVRRRMGMVFQQFNLFPHLSVIENVTEAPIRVAGLSPAEARDKGESLLARVGVLAKAEAMPGTLSGGEQQRVAIARALAMDPDVLLFDEPTSALDPRMQDEVLAVMAELARGGQTMVVVTHAMSFARRAASTVHVFGDGEVMASGTPDEILRPRSGDESFETAASFDAATMAWARP